MRLPPFAPPPDRGLRPKLDTMVEFEMELAASRSLFRSELDGRITERDFQLELEYFQKHGRFPGQRPSLM